MNPSKHKLVYWPRNSQNLHNTQNVPVSLHNRFEVLADMNGEDNGCVHNSTSRDSSVHDTDSLYVTEASKHSFQHSQECKHPFRLGKSQPLLAAQENSTLLGNKNKTGVFAGDSTYTKTSSDDSIMQNSSATHVVPFNVSKFSKVVGDVGTTLQPQLADKKYMFLVQ